MDKLYKILVNGKSCHGGNLQWSLPNGKPGDWHEIQGTLNMCTNGIHLTDKPAKWFRWNCSMYEAEYEGEILWDKNESKQCARKVRLIKEVPTPQWWREVHTFVEKDIPSVQWLRPDLKPRKEWRLFKAQTRAAAWDAAWAAAWDAAGNGARAAARAAAQDAAQDAAWAAAWDAAGNGARAAARAAAQDAAQDAAQVAAWAAARAGAQDAAQDAAWAAAQAAAGNAARAAAQDAAQDAAWAAARAAAGAAAGDAALLARVKVCRELKLDKKHIDHANARWEVWQKGYALLCDVNGDLYVYAAELNR